MCCICILKFYQPLDTIKFACNSAGTEKLPDDDVRASKHVGAVEWSNINYQKVHLLVIYKYRTKYARYKGQNPFMSLF
jgi:hypothetical protein